MNKKVIQATDLNQLRPVQVQEKVMAKMMPEKQKNDFTKSVEGVHHKTIIVPNYGATASGILGGCGIMNYSNFIYDSVESLPITLKAIQENINQRRGYKCTMLIARLGFRKSGRAYIYDKYHKALLNAGFKVLAEYKNSVHDAVDDWQRLYGLDFYKPPVKPTT